jgi:glutamate dehydrogenase/leucine dehydrogenase
VFIPAAASRLVSQDQLDRMLSNGLEVISAGANVPFADQEIFYGSISEHADQNCAVIPDFISNCGMARVFGYLMATQDELSDTRIFEDVSETIKSALENTHSRRTETTLLTSTAYDIALDQLI